MYILQALEKFMREVITNQQIGETCIGQQIVEYMHTVDGVIAKHGTHSYEEVRTNISLGMHTELC